LLQNSVVVKSEKHQKFAIVKGELVLQDKQPKKINSIEMWTDAFIVYLSIHCSVHCKKNFGVLNYMNTIRMAAKRCGSNIFGWKNYDEQYRLTIAGNSSASWGK
jgi:hypothetical protein